MLEHLENVYQLFDIMTLKKRGTFFAFSVPTFGFSTIIESAFSDHCARNLDNVVHTQLYTYESINYAMENSGYEIIGEWIFGQDSQDLISFLKFKLDHVYKEIKDEVYEKLNSLLNPVQCEIDKKRFADAIHILAIKK